MALIAAFVFSAACQQPSQPTSPTLTEVKAALASGEYERAAQLAASIPSSSPDWKPALAIRAEALAKLGRPDDAVRQYRDLASLQRQSREPPLALFYAGETYFASGRLAEAVGCYRELLTNIPRHTLSHERLAFLMNASGQRWKSLPHYLALVQSGTAEVNELVLMADLDRPIEQRPYLEECERKAPDDPFVKLGLAAHAFWEGRLDEATERLKRLVAAAPELLDGQALLGELLVNRSDGEFAEWHSRLPDDADEHPDIWYVRGLWARKHDQPQTAARCFWESIRIAPTYRRATFQLGLVLRSLDHPAAEAVETRARQLIELTQHLDAVLRSENLNEAAFCDAALLLEQTGRIWEAGGWGIAARGQFPQAVWPEDLLARVAAQLNDRLPLVLDRENLALRYDLSGFPRFELLAQEWTGSTPRTSASSAAIRFEEPAARPDFTYMNGGDPATPGARMFEQTGGGVAVLDFDRDGWPDLFFPQGGEWPTGQIEPPPPGNWTDRLFRNRQAEAAVDVTAAAALVDRGFGQGAASGDFDNDGFADLYVANVGRNQLLRNNGDGTFTDVTEAAGLSAADWTTSCVIVDLNADGCPDLYDVNYVTGRGVYEALCDGKACSPSNFAGAPDRLLLSRGDGAFELVPPLKPEVDGKGMGVIAFDWQERGRPSLFIANDQVPNFLLHNAPGDDRHNLRLKDEAFVSGAAFNQDGLAMASMGIAAEDADGDGRLDFYVTTFKDEASMLLLQDASGLFADAGTPAGFRSATWPFVGWGTQFLDADRDGLPDLIAVNGHVDDYRDQAGEYHMRPQFFRNVGTARFEELTAAQLGPFFEQKRLGRGLSRLDWNRDGLLDFAVSNMGDRVSLVLNATRSPGHYLSVRIVANATARDAIGSIIELRAGDRTWSKQMVAGDGYMASNERLVQFGLGDATNVDEVTVHWPGGARSTVRQLSVDGTLELIEARSWAILQRGPEASSIVDVTIGRDEK